MHTQLKTAGEIGLNVHERYQNGLLNLKEKLFISYWTPCGHMLDLEEDEYLIVDHYLTTALQLFSFLQTCNLISFYDNLLRLRTELNILIGYLDFLLQGAS